MKKVLLGLLVITQMSLSASFDISIEKTLAFEGSKVFKTSFNELSRYGITDKTLSKFNKSYKTNWSVYKLTKEQAKTIYLKEYWNRQRLDSVDSQVVANNVFDFTVNAGFYQATKQLQLAINKACKKAGLNQIDSDGVLGSQTINKLNQLTRLGYENYIVKQYKINRLNHAKSLNVEKNSKGQTKWDLFKDNWTMRINGI